MARWRRRRRAGRGSLGTAVVVVVSLFLASRKAWPALVIVWIFALVLWVAFFRSTACDVETKDGDGCGNPAHGALRACHLTKHKRAKHDALWRIFGRSNPAIQYRIKWAQQRSNYGRETPRLEESGQPRQALRASISPVVSVISCPLPRIAARMFGQWHTHVSNVDGSCV